MCDIKVNSVQETRAKCLAVQILKFEILQITWNKEPQTLSFQLFANKFSIFMFLALFFSCGLQDFKF